MSPQTLTQELVAYAQSQGVELTGCTSAASFTIGEAKREIVPESMLPGARSIVVAVCAAPPTAHYRPSLPGVPRGRVEASTRTAAPAYDHALQVITEFLAQRGYRTTAGHELPQKAAAVRAGVAAYGRNCTVHAEGIGSYLAVVAVLTDAELTCIDQPVATSDCPEDCGACVEACPTGALSRERPFRLARERCICSYLWGAPIPREHRKAIGDRLFRCEACTTACRRNQALVPRAPRGYTQQEGEDSPELLPLLFGDTDYFQRALCGFTQQAGVDTLRRNAAIAAGNSGDPAVVPGLVACLESPHLLTRVAAAWALGRIGGAQAVHALTARFTVEVEEEVRTEITWALGDPSH